MLLMPKSQTHFQADVYGVFFPLPLQKMTLPLALVALISAFGSSFQYGYNVSVINSPAPVSAPAWGGLQHLEHPVN